MKKLIAAFILISGISVHSEASTAEDSTGLPGDHFSLEIALDLFRQSASVEDFEKKINDQSSHANNLDINGDGEVDYIRVVDYAEGSDHAITLQVPVSETESQDIAVIEIEKNGEESAIAQIVGDEDIYGSEKYVEPEEEKASGSKGGPSASIETVGIVVNVWFWPGVRFLYGPAYRPWVSPWKWRHYPGYWRPWRPIGWSVYYGFCRPFHARYPVVTVHRCTRVHVVYRSHRVASPAVRVRYKDAHERHRTTVVVKEKSGKSAGKSKATKSGKKERTVKEPTMKGGEKSPGKTGTGAEKTKSKTARPAKGGGGKGGSGKRK